MSEQILHISQLPAPKIIRFSDEEMRILNKRLHDATYGEDEKAKEEIQQIYPYDAEMLDSLKLFYGLEFLVRNGYNLVKAVDTYGERWLEYNEPIFKS